MNGRCGESPTGLTYGLKPPDASVTAQAVRLFAESFHDVSGKGSTSATPQQQPTLVHETTSLAVPLNVDNSGLIHYLSPKFLLETLRDIAEYRIKHQFVAPKPCNKPRYASTFSFTESKISNRT